MDEREAFVAGGAVGGGGACDPGALRLAVVARIRHEHTNRDERLMRHGDRRLARQDVAADIDRVPADGSLR